MDDNEIKEKIGDTFQEMTKYARSKISGGFLDWRMRPDLYKTYREKPFISLPEPEMPEVDFWKVLKHRRSRRKFTGQPLSLFELSALLWASQGITAVTRGFELRAAPSAGALYPVETYVYAHDAGELERGMYHYNVKNHGMEFLESGSYVDELTSACLGQNMIRSASIVCIWTAVVMRSKWKYKQRAYRYIYLDAGHIAQNLVLASEALGLNACPIGAFFDEEINGIVGVDGKEETALYLVAAGKK